MTVEEESEDANDIRLPISELHEISNDKLNKS